jgi:BirA family biotin operon repressor/biotin-[acetyl-CoA-carboxylase] ligase
MNNPMKEWLSTSYVGQNTIVLDSLESTNDYAKDLLTENPPNGTVILTKTQTKGRGQKTNVWASPEGGLYYSCILNAQQDDKLTMITLICGIACHDAIN